MCVSCRKGDETSASLHNWAPEERRPPPPLWSKQAAVRPGLTMLMTRTVRLRRWQKAALDQFVAAPKPDFLAIATPGAGKTTFALTAARHQLAERPGRLIVVAPTAHLKIQWARAAAAFSLH